MKLSIVVPCYDEEAVLPEIVRRLTGLLERMAAAGKISGESNIYFVDDGSRDSTWRLLEQYAGSNPGIRAAKLSRNKGHQNALLAGLQIADGDAIVSIDADLQDDIEVIEVMVDRFLEGCEIVYGVRADRTSDSFLKRWTAELYYVLLRRMGVDVVFNHADYRLLSRRVVTCLEGYPEVNLFLRGIMPLLGFRSAQVPYVRSERYAGESKYPLRKMFGLALQGVTSFSVFPLRLITWIGFAVFVISAGLGLWALAIRIFTTSAIPGWASTVMPNYFLGGIQLLCTGVIGEYLAKIYIEVKRRPRYHIEKLL